MVQALLFSYWWFLKYSSISGAQQLTIRPQHVIYLFPVPFWHYSHVDRRLVLLMCRNLLSIMLYMTLLADKKNLLYIKKSLTTQQDITASSSVV